MLKPEYLFRPRQLVLRFARWRKPQLSDWRVLALPWGDELEANVAEAIGQALWQLGVYDLVVSEALWRLTDPGERVADAGANIGYMTVLLSARVGPTGKVVSFEPHPELFKKLSANAARCQNAGRGKIILRNVAVSDRKGQGWLKIPANFDSNQGLSALSQSGIPVELVTLSEEFAVTEPPSLIKMDIEGFEARGLAGAEALLSRNGPVRDVIFEDHGRYPTESMNLLQTRGYELFQLRRSFLGPKLARADAEPPRNAWEPMSYLATIDPDRARKRLGACGWQILKQ